MKSVIYNLFIMSFMILFSSCLTSGLEELDVYEGADITSVSTVRYRYITDEKSPASGEFIVKEVDLSYTSNIDVEAGKVQIFVTVPDGFPESELANLSKSNLLIAVALSTAARLSPLDGAPLLGVPGNWESPNLYLVEAADGTKKNWTIEVASLEK